MHPSKANALPARVPQTRWRWTRTLCLMALRPFGWKVIVRDFPDVPQAVITLAPHTSNWDWVICILAAYGIGIRASWLGKHTLFAGPLGPLFRALRGVPIDRSATEGVVEQIVAEFERHEQMMLALTPQGTRSAGARFRTGYHRIARGAGVPVILATIDYPSRTVTIGDRFELTDDREGDTARLVQWYEAYRGRGG